MNAGCSDFTIANNHIDGNNVMNNDGKHGINIGGGVSGFRILGNRIGNSSAGFAGHQRSGIAINTGASTDYVIANNDCRGNETSAIADNGTGTKASLRDNLGHTPPAAAFVAGSSPYTYTAGHTDETLYISGGAVSLITIAGVGVFASTDRTLMLHANESIVITHSAAPTLLRVPRERRSFVSRDAALPFASFSRFTTARLHSTSFELGSSG